MSRQIARVAAAFVFGAAAIVRPAAAQSPPDVSAPKEESAESLPAGPGREAAFGMCSACHAYRLVASQAMSRERWDETMVVMTQKHGMPDLKGKQRETILNYLAKTHPPKTSTGAGGFKSPFAPQ